MRTRAKRDVWERFFEKVVEADDLSPNGWSGCWVWTARTLPNGYGHFWLDGKKRLAHRVAYALVIGVIPADRELDHRCRRHNCVNPAHLEPVTHQENMRRSAPAQRTVCPQGHPRRGVTWDAKWGRCRLCHAARERARA